MKTEEQTRTTTMWIASKGAVGCDIEGEMVLLDLESGTYFGLNAVGAEIWNHLREERSFDEIQRHLLSIYNVSPARCETEVAALLHQLREKGLVSSRNVEVAA